MGLLIRRRILLVTIAAGLLIGGSSSLAQSAAEVTASYIVHFVRFTTWPVDALGSGVPVVICVAGNDWVATELTQLARTQKVEGRPLSVRRTRLDDDVSGCHVFYGSNLNGDQTERLLRTTSVMPILTLSDAADFAERGGIANFFIDDGRLRFSVNPGAATRARLQISSRLLSLAKIVGS